MRRTTIGETGERSSAGTEAVSTVELSPGSAEAGPAQDQRRLARKRRRFASVAASASNDAIPALVITGFATVVAMFLTPQNVVPRLALFWPALVMSAGLAIIPMIKAFSAPKQFFLSHYLLALAPIYWMLLDLLQGVYDLEGVAQKEARLAFLAIGLFAAAMWLGVMGRPWRLPQAVRQVSSLSLSPPAIFWAAVVAFGLAMLKYAIPCGFDAGVMYENLFVDRFSAPWADSGGWNAFSYHLGYFGYLLPAFAVALGCRQGWLNARTLLTLGMASIMTAFMAQDGGRRNVGVVIGMGIICWVCLRKRFSVRSFVVVGLACAFLLGIMQFMHEYRNFGFQAAFSDQEDEPVQGSQFIRVDDNYYRLCQMIQLIPAEHPYVHLKYFGFVLVRPVPRVFWPGKPMDGGFSLADALGERGVSLTSTVIGEFYMSGGFLFILLGGWFFGRLAVMANQLMPQSDKTGAAILYCIMVMALFAGMRSLVDLVLISYVVLAWIVLCWLYTFWHGQRATAVSRPLQGTEA